MVMIIVLLIVLGLCLGSFVNALVWRVHEQAKPKKSRSSNIKELSILNGRSMCPSCKHILSPLDLFPVFSWISLSGKCRYCKQPISWQYPLVELATATLFVLSYVVWPYQFGLEGVILFVGWMAVLTGLMALIVYDLRWMLLPNRILFPLTIIWTTVIIIKTAVTRDIASLLLAVLASFIFFAIFWLLFQLSGGRWIGGGDVKLAVLLGLIVGNPFNSILAIFIASYIGTLLVLPKIIQKGWSHRTSAIPFGPPLIAAAIILFLTDDKIIAWYRDLFII